jgi:hypothetical protein
VYVVFRDGRPIAAHMTGNFSRDITTRFPVSELQGELTQAEEESEDEYGRSRRRRRRRRGYGRRGYRFRYGRFRRRGGLSRRARIALLRSLRRSTMQEPPDDGQDDSDDSDDMDDSND